MIFKCIRCSLVAFVLIALLSLNSCENKPAYESKAIDIFPPHDLFTVALFRMNNLNIAPAYFKGKWSVVLLGHAPCDVQCKENLALLEAIEGVQKLFVFDNPAATSHIQQLSQQFESISITMGATATATDYFFAQFDIEGIDQALKYESIYFVNPQGQIQYALALQGATKKEIELEIKAAMENNS